MCVVCFPFYLRLVTTLDNVQWTCLKNEASAFHVNTCSAWPIPVRSSIARTDLVSISTKCLAGDSGAGSICQSYNQTKRYTWPTSASTTEKNSS